uniref:Uncharacterized protein n=1 Tax=Oryza sativa subsp. japonica TaxID=39947 RepID=Q6K7C1_ORYSJ|nr:hypothetical protein [Oryza sativa Japonica Group]
MIFLDKHPNRLQTGHKCAREWRPPPVTAAKPRTNPATAAGVGDGDGRRGHGGPLRWWRRGIQWVAAKPDMDPATAAILAWIRRPVALPLSGIRRVATSLPTTIRQRGGASAALRPERRVAAVACFRGEGGCIIGDRGNDDGGPRIGRQR